MDYDVIVCGAGPAGTAAAIAAARQGARVLLVERYGFAGGMATSSLVNPWMGHAFRDPDTGQACSLIGGFFKEVVSTMKSEGAVGSGLTPAAFDEERLKVVYDRLLQDAGVDVRYHTLLVGMRIGYGHVHCIETVAKEGRETWGAKAFVDATGDGDLAAMGAFKFTVGRPSDGLSQAMTTSFRMANVDKDEMLRQGSLRDARMLVEPLFQEARRAGRLDYPYRDFVQFYDYPRPGVLHFNMTRITGVSGLLPKDLTYAEMEGRRQAATLADWLIRDVPYFRNAYLSKIACQVGVRETRHIEGLYTMSQEDIVQGRKFADGIVRSCYFIDIHSPTGSGFDHEVQGTLGKAKPSYAPPKGDYYEVPYRAIVPAGSENMLVACRALSATHEGAAAVRVMATMTGIGQAAGHAAAKIAKDSVHAAEVGGEWLRHELAYLDQGPDPDPLWR